MDFALNKWVSVGASLRGNYSVTDEIPSGDSQSSIMANLQRKLPYEPVYEPDGSYANRERPNLVAVANEFEGESSQIAGIGSLYATLHIIEGLDFKTFLASDFYNNTGNSFYPSLILGGATRPSSAYSNKGNTWLNENVLSYTLRTDRISLTSIIGYSAQENSSFNFNAAASGGPTDLIPTMNAAPLKETATSTTSGWGITSLFSRVNFSYDGKYLTSLSFRRDGSSRFGSENRYAFFPAASVAWRISNEDFMENLTYLDELKLRASIGRTGNQNIGNYVAQGTYNTGANYNGQAGVLAGGIPSSDLSWETTDQVDVGFDLVMLRSRIDFSADFYRKNTFGLLFSMPLPNYTGFSSYWTNLGKIENKGMEYSLNADIIRGNSFNWSAGFNISFNQNKVLELPNGTPIINSSATGVYYTVNAGFITEEGLPIGQFYGLKWTGEVYPTNEDALAHVTKIMGQPAVGGTLKYEDFKEDKVIDANDRQLLGSPHPDFFGGLNTQVSYRNFDLGMQFSYVYGNLLFNQMRFLGSRGFIYDAGLKERIDAWAYPGHITTEHKAMHGTDQRDNQFSSKYLEDGSYLRLNNLTLGYTLPQSATQKISLNNLRVYLSAQNLLTLTKYKGWDPEVNAKPGDIRTQGVDIGMIPQQSAFLLGLNVNF